MKSYNLIRKYFLKFYLNFFEFLFIIFLKYLPNFTFFNSSKFLQCKRELIENKIDIFWTFYVLILDICYL